MNILARAGLAGATVTLACLALAVPARASCGSAFCSINTNWSVQSAPENSGTSIDIRYEYIDQSTVRSRSNKVAVGQIPNHHDEVSTVNHNVVATIDHTFTANWGVTAQVPVATRDHKHIHNHHGAKLQESWDFTKIGDVRVGGRYSVTEGVLDGFGMTAGLKLPTGQFGVTNGNGDVAERSLQPGTGTTDALVGVFHHANLPEWSSSWFAQVTFQKPLGERDGYKPGAQVGFDLGAQYDATEKLSMLLQINTMFRGRDWGSAAEPANSGRTVVALSPGVSYAFSSAISAYAFVQKPVYQYVNGVQLAPAWSGVAGLRTRF